MHGAYARRHRPRCQIAPNISTKTHTSTKTHISAGTSGSGRARASASTRVHYDPIGTWLAACASSSALLAGSLLAEPAKLMPGDKEADGDGGTVRQYQVDVLKTLSLFGG